MIKQADQLHRAAQDGSTASSDTTEGSRVTAQPDLEQAAPPPARKASTRGRVVKWVLVTLGVLAMAFVALVAVVIIEWSGGFKWVFTIAPEASDKNVVEANSAGNVPRDKLVSGLQNANAAAGLVRVARTTPAPYCWQGQHNWKINDNYDLRCGTSTSVVSGSTLPSPVYGSTLPPGPVLKAQLLAFHDQLTAQGWKSGYSTKKVDSIQDKLEESSRSDTQSLLTAADGVTYHQGGEFGEQGSAKLTVGLTNSEHDFRIEEIGRPPYGASIPPDGANARSATERYLHNRADRYVVHMKITYLSFSQ